MRSATPRSVALLALALAALLAGCAAPVPAADAPRAEAPAAGPERAVAAHAADAPRLPERPTFPAPTLVAVMSTAEPGVAVGPDGTAFVNVWAAPYRAASPGAAWSPLGAPFDVWGDTDLAVDAEGVVHMVGMALGANAGPRLPYARSFDGGVTWEPARDLSRGAAIDRPWITAAPGGLLVLTWNELGARENLVRVSRDGGDTWEDPIVLPGPFQNLPGPAAVHGDLILQPLHSGGAVRLARSLDAGATWTLVQGPVPASWLHIFATLAFDAAGNAYVAGAFDPVPTGDPLGPRPRVHVWRPDDAGDTWGLPEPVSPPGATAIFPWIVAGDEGRVAVAWYESALPASPTNERGAWFVGIGVTASADVPGAWLPARVKETPIRLGAICTGGASCVSGDWSMKDYFEMALTPEGRPILAWTEDAALLDEGSGGMLRVVTAAATGGWRAWDGAAPSAARPHV